MAEYILSAFVFGLAAGFKPGPLGIVVIQQTLEHGFRQGLKASLAPIITDGPIIIAALLVLTQLKDLSCFVGLLSTVGGIYLLWLAFRILRIQEINTAAELGDPRSLQTAIKVNLLSPNPYLFWFAVGGTYLVTGTTLQAAAFIVVSIGTLVAAKIITAWIAANFRAFLDGRVYVWVMRVLGAGLLIFGALFLSRAYQALTGS